MKLKEYSVFLCDKTHGLRTGRSGAFPHGWMMGILSIRYLVFFQLKGGTNNHLFFFSSHFSFSNGLTFLPYQIDSPISELNSLSEIGFTLNEPGIKYNST